MTTIEDFLAQKLHPKFSFTIDDDGLNLRCGTIQKDEVINAISIKNNDELEEFSKLLNGKPINFINGIIYGKVNIIAIETLTI